MIVITAPTGNIGHQVLDHVLGKGEQVRVVVRDPARLPVHVRDQVEVVQGSHGDPDVIGRALDGADALFWLLPTGRPAAGVEEAFVDFTRPAARAVREQGVGRVVSASALGRGTSWAEKAGFVTGSLAMDDLLASTGAAFRALASATYMDNVGRQASVIAEQGVFYDGLDPDLALPFVATRDIAGTAARLLLDRTWTGQEEVPLLGPENLSSNDMAAVVSDVLGTPVRYQQISEEAFKGLFTGRGVSEGMAQGMLDMLVAKSNGLDLGVARTPQLAADTPTTFRLWCEDTLRPAVRAGRVAS